MATAGEAAALFGSTDLASDPFTSVDNQTETRDIPSGDALFSGQEVSAANELFGSSVDQSGLYSSAETYPSHSSSSYAHSASSWGALSAQPADYGSTTATVASSSYSGHTGQIVSNEWGGQSQASGYGSQQYAPSVNGSYNTYSQPAMVQQYGQYTPYGSVYNPPAPTTQEATHGRGSSYGSYLASSSYEASSTSAPPAQSAYEQYRPPQYAAPAPPVTTQAHSAYTPAVPPSTVPVPQPSTIEVPQPPKVTSTAAVYRPKTSNAYDPPLLPPKPAPKRIAAWNAPHSPAQPQYAFGSSPAVPQTAPQSATFPPPPRIGSAALPPPLRASSASVPPPRASTASLPPPPSRTASAVRQFAALPPPVPSAPYNPPAAQTADPYSSPPRPSRSHFDVPFAPSQRQSWALVEGSDHTQTQSPKSPQMDPYGPISQRLARPDAQAGPYDGLPAPSLGGHSAVAADSHQLYSAPIGRDSYGVARQEKSTGIAAETVHGISQPHVNELVRNEVHSATPSAALESADPEDVGSSWDFDAAEGSTHDRKSPTSGSVASRPTSPWVQQLVPPAVSSKGSVSSPSAAYDPYRPNGAASQQSPPRTLSPERTRSPGGSSVKSWSSSHRHSLEQTHAKASSPPLHPATQGVQRHPSVDSHGSPPVNPYEPSSVQRTGIVQRTASPSSFSVRSVRSTHSVQSAGSAVRRDSSAYDSYTPQNASVASACDRSMSNTSAYSATGLMDDPYAPSRYSRQQTFEAPAYGSFVAMSPHREPAAPPIPAPAQTLTLAPATAAPYAPSPSLLGTNDPLGRTSVRIPVVSFGFGGKVVTCFHTSSVLSTGFDVAMSSRASTELALRPLHTVIPQSALDTSAVTYPGPLFSDPGTPSTTLVRPGAAAQAKTKKTRVIKYLEERSEEMARGLGYLQQDSMEGYRAAAKQVLINLLKVLVENDGRLSGSPQIDTAIRAALLPGLDVTTDKSMENLKTPALGFGLPSELTSHAADTTVSISSLRTSHLEKIQSLLLRGDRQGAYQYAADEKLWAHAMVIASSIDKEAWKEVVNEFVRAELSGQDTGDNRIGRGRDAKPVATGREPLKVAYSLFAGHGPAAVQELMPPKPLTSLTQLHPIPAVPPASALPVSPSFPPAFQTSPVPQEILVKWAETAAMIINSPMAPETSSALAALGDQLAANGWVEAAHACYLLSPQTSPVGGLGVPSVKVTLYGAASSQLKTSFWKDPDPIIFSEIVEFAMSLSTPAKGQEAFAGLPHLQPYRLIRATSLAEMGHVQVAARYCEAISNSLTRPSPYLNATFVEQLRGLSDRLVAAPIIDKSGSWIGSKVTRPSLDRIGNWLEGRFTSFIAGDDESPKHEETRAREHTFSGPFAHYSTISSTTSSTMPSPQMSAANLAEMHPASVPTRTGSAMAPRPANGGPIARASSAIDYLRRKPSPVPRISSASAASPNFNNVPGWSQLAVANGYAPIPEMTPRAERASKLAEVHVEEDESVQEASASPQTGSWWGASNMDVRTPTASSFDHPEALVDSSTEGFVSLMNAPTFGAPISQSRTASGTSSYGQFDEEDDELGLGNSAFRKKENQPSSATATPEAEPPVKEQAPKSEAPKELEKHAASSGGWLSRLWKKSDSNPGPVKANLGDESSFHYDKELKRWVNKHAAAETAKPSPPPPPPRAQTASPATTAPRDLGAPTVPSLGPPPARPATAMDSTGGPPKKPPMRVRSNLVPDETSSAPPTPFSMGSPRTPSAVMDGPPGIDGIPSASSRAASRAKRNARSRYVDVFQQDTEN